jgi:hypothetical protein
MKVSKKIMDLLNLFEGHLCYFPKYNAVSCIFQNKKKINKIVSFLDHTISPSSSPGHATGEEKFLFFSLVSPSLSSPSHVLC